MDKIQSGSSRGLPAEVAGLSVMSACTQLEDGSDFLKILPVSALIMSSVQYQRDFLTAAGQTPLQDEEEREQQRRLLDVTWRPLMTSADLQDQDVCKEEEVLWNQQRNSSLDQQEPEPPCTEEEQQEPEPPGIKEEQQEPEPPGIKEEQQEVFISQQEEQLDLKQETDTMLHFKSEKDEPLRVSEDPSTSSVPASTPVQSEEEPDHQHKLLESYLQLHVIGLPHQHVCKEEDDVLDQQRNSSLDQQEPEPPHMKEDQPEPEPEQQDLCSSQDLVLKQEDGNITVTVNHDSEDSSDEEELLSHRSAVAESREDKEAGGPRSNAAELKPGRRKTSAPLSERHSDAGTHRNCLKCDVCEKCFKKKSSLSNHQRTHHGEKPYSCKTCGRCFSLRSNLLCHMRVHSGEKMYSCKRCGKSFSSTSGLVYHIRTHTGEKPHSCQTCGRCFSLGSTLFSHMRTHTGEKPFSCETCGKSFSRNTGLLYHMRTHTGEKPYSCQTCGKSFSRNTALLYHMREHTGEKPYSCEICGKSYRHNTSFVYHVKTHTGDKPYFCQFCGKRFCTNSDLVCHLRTHTGEKPYPCKVCGRCFSVSSGLSRHMKTHQQNP